VGAMAGREYALVFILGERLYTKSRGQLASIR
jgi:hypothetical protein